MAALINTELRRISGRFSNDAVIRVRIGDKYYTVEDLKIDRMHRNALELVVGEGMTLSEEQARLEAKQSTEHIPMRAERAEPNIIPKQPVVEPVAEPVSSPQDSGAINPESEQQVADSNE